MKNYKTALFVGAIFILAIIAYSFVGKDPAKNTSLAQNQAAQDKTLTENSFSVKKAPGAGQGKLDPVAAMVNSGKTFLLKRVDSRIKQLEPFKDRIESMAGLNDSDKKSLVAELSAEIDTFKTFGPEISRSETKEDVKNIADKVKAEWLKSGQSVKRAEELFLGLKENQLVMEAGEASEGIQKRIDALKAEGKDAKPYEKLLSEYNKKIASAKQDVESVNEKFDADESTLTSGEKEKLLKEKNLSLTSAQNSIKDAYKLLREEAQKDFARKVK